MSLKEWSERELSKLGSTEDEAQQWINQQILELVETFSNQGHSGYSAAYALSVFNRLASWKPLTALTGEDDEWTQVEGPNLPLWQNKRCPTVFKEEYSEGEIKAYHSEAVVYSDDGGETWFTDSNSRREIEFPFIVPDEPERVVLEEGQKDG